MDQFLGVKTTVWMSYPHSTEILAEQVSLAIPVIRLRLELALGPADSRMARKACADRMFVTT